VINQDSISQPLTLDTGTAILKNVLHLPPEEIAKWMLHTPKDGQLCAYVLKKAICGYLASIGKSYLDMLYAQIAAQDEEAGQSGELNDDGEDEEEEDYLHSFSKDVAEHVTEAAAQVEAFEDHCEDLDDEWNARTDEGMII
jgi:hypothetical protein